MAERKQRVLDVWILEINMVYREVPFVVVTDWLQQGRLLAEDCVRLAGSKKWHAIRTVPALAPYLPRTEPQRADDRAEALEPVELGMDWRRPGEEEDDDVDMIPLIDISLVLLIFFMMSASVESGVQSTISTPSAKHQLAAITRGSFWIGMDSKSGAGTVEKDNAGRPLTWFSFGKDNSLLLAPTPEARQVADALTEQLQDLPGGEIVIRLRADKTLPIETIKSVTVDLQELQAQLNRARTKDKKEALKFAILGEVSEPKGR